MNDQKTKTVFDERAELLRQRDGLAAQNGQLHAQLSTAINRLAATEEALQHIQADLEAARKGADAAVLYFDFDGDVYADYEVWLALKSATDEYRAHLEAQAVMFRPGVKRGMEKLEGMD